jgi:hypothetical protein
VTLQQLDTTLKQSLPWGWNLYVTANSLTGAMVSAETDFIWLTQNRTGRIQLVIGECKANATIADEDLQKDTENRVDVYILFSKTSDFTSSELNIFKASLKTRVYRLILMSRRELEPYHIYEWAEKELGRKLYVSTLDQMVSATETLYLKTDQSAGGE